MKPLDHIKAALSRALSHGMDVSEVQMAVDLCECPAQLLASVDDVARAKVDLGVGAAWSDGRWSVVK